VGVDRETGRDGGRRAHDVRWRSHQHQWRPLDAGKLTHNSTKPCYIYYGKDVNDQIKKVLLLSL